jgi:spore coat protein A
VLKKYFLVGIGLIGITFASADNYGHSAFYTLLHKLDVAAPDGAIDISRFVDALPILPTIKAGNRSQITMVESEVSTQFYKNLPPTKVWGFNGISPGPIIEVQSGHPLEVLWKNSLPTTHLFPVDDASMEGMNNPARLPPGFTTLPEVRTATHLHGAAVTETDLSNRLRNNDGWPDNWVVPGETQISEYPNPQSSRMLWYHDHAMGTTARNVNAGLVGLYIIRDAYEASLNLPSGKYEVPIVFQTRDFDNDGNLLYPAKVTNEVYGSAVTVNGKVWPYLNVEPRKYRFRMVNATDARSLQLKLVNTLDSSAGPLLYQIGSDSGFLENTAVLNDPATPNSPQLNLNPAERADLIVDFSKSAGSTLMLYNSNVGDVGDSELILRNIIAFKVGTTVNSADHSALPMHMKTIRPLVRTATTPQRQIVLSELDTPNEAPLMMLNGKVWDDPVTDVVKLGSTEVWELVDTLPDGHPFHVHEVQFQVLDRQPFDVAQYQTNQQIVYTGPPVPLDPAEKGWKDVTFLQSGYVTHIITKFGPYPGMFVFHCHILEHEDMGMMRPFQVVP